MISGEGFKPSEHDLNLKDRTRVEIRDPEDVVLIKTPKAKETYRESEGKLLISPENLMPNNVSVVVGARTAPKGEFVFGADVFAEEAGLDKSDIIRIKQKHTNRVLEVAKDQTPAFEYSDSADERISWSDGTGVDACWTKDENVTLMIGSADCAAVTIAGKDKNGQEIIGIAHSGIAGTQKDLVGNLIKEMIEKGDADPASFKVYVAPSICDKCFPILSEALPADFPHPDSKGETDPEKIEKYYTTLGEQQARIEKARSSVNPEITSATESFIAFKEKYGEKFRELFRRELHQNDFFYIAQNDKGQNELHYRVDNQILVSLMCNGVNLRDIGFSNLCTKNDGLPSARGTQETTGVYSTITINKEKENKVKKYVDQSFHQSVEEAAPRRIEEWDDDGIKTVDWERPDLSDESEPLEGHQIIDALSLSEAEKNILKEKVAKNAGLITLYVHPYSEYGVNDQYYKDGKEPAPDLQRVYDRLRDLMTVPDNERAPVFIMEERNQIHALHHIIKGINRGKVYTIPTCYGDPEPKPREGYKVAKREQNDFDFIESEGYTKMIEVFKDLGVSKVILNGLYLSVGSDREYSSGQKIGMSRCVGIVMRALKAFNFGDPKIGEFTYPDGHRAMKMHGLTHFISEPEDGKFEEAFVEEKNMPDGQVEESTVKSSPKEGIITRWRKRFGSSNHKQNN